MNCCDDFGQCTQGADCPARAHLHTHNGGQRVDTALLQPCGELPRIAMGDELFHADCWMGICARAAIFLIVFLAAGCWWFRVPAFLWR